MYIHVSTCFDVRRIYIVGICVCVCVCVCSGQEEYGQLKKKNKVLQGEATLYHDELEKEKNKNETLLAEVCTVLYCTVLYCTVPYVHSLCISCCYTASFRRMKLWSTQL